MAILDRGPLGHRGDGRPKTRLNMLVVLLIAVAVTISLGAVVLEIKGSHGTPPRTPAPARIAYVAHDPISIQYNSGFLDANSSTGISRGSGTASDPYIIEGWQIEVFGSDYNVTSVVISHTTDYFIIQNCNILRYGATFTGAIILDDCLNGMVRDCVCECTSSDGGYHADIRLQWSSQNKILNNTCRGNAYGVWLEKSSGNTVRDNNCSNHNSAFGDVGIWIDSGDSNIVADNNCSLAGIGILLEYSWSNSVIDNNCSGAQFWGIRLYQSPLNELVNNSCSNCLIGIGLDVLCNGTTVTRNNCSYDSEAGITSGYSGHNTIVDNICSYTHWYGIWFQAACDDNYVAYNNCSNNSAGIMLQGQSCNNTLFDNGCYGNTDGIYLETGSNNNTLDSNKCSGGMTGIFSSTNGNTLVRDKCEANNGSGIELAGSDDNVVAYNECRNNGAGMAVTGGSDNNDIFDNVISDNIGLGLFIGGTDCHSSTIWNNTFFHNNGSGDVYDILHAQAVDNCDGNWWNSSDGYGNWWSDWTVPDMDGDGIVDIPYDIVGTAGAKDNYPRTNVIVPEFSSSIVFVCSIISLAIVVVGMRRLRIASSKRDEKKDL